MELTLVKMLDVIFNGTVENKNASLTFKSGGDVHVKLDTEHVTAEMTNQTAVFDVEVRHRHPIAKMEIDGKEVIKWEVEPVNMHFEVKGDISAQFDNRLSPDLLKLVRRIKKDYQIELKKSA